MDIYGSSASISRPKQVESLLVILICVIIHHIEESELVNTLRRRYNTKPIPQLLLFQEFFRPNIKQVN